MDLFRLWVGQSNWLLCKQMWRLCALNITLKSLFSLGIVHMTWTRVRYVKTNMAAMHSVSAFKILLVIWHCLHDVTFVDITSCKWLFNLNSNALNHVVMCLDHLLYIRIMSVMRTAAEYCYGHVAFILWRCRWALSPCP